MTISKQQSDRVLKVSGTLDIGIVEELRDALRDGLNLRPVLVLDLSGADSCDIAVLQLLNSTCKTAQRDGKRFELIGVSGMLSASVAEFGIPMAALQNSEGPDFVSEEHPGAL